MDNEKVAAAMQDNVTQAALEWLAAEQTTEEVFASTERFTETPDERLQRIAARKEARDQAVLNARAALASTAQPEVKALVEALEAIKAQTSAEDDAGENYRWDDREGALDFAYATAAQALAAYHEAQP